MTGELTARRILERKFNVPRETFVLLDAFVRFLVAENEKQNLVSRGTLAEVWNRHILDSAQLVQFTPSPEARWLDLGTGAGFPGLIVAMLHPGRVTLVEERRKRTDFLARALDLLGLGAKVTIIAGKIERAAPQPFDVISARAFAPLARLFELSHDFSTTKTRFILPKGRNASSELEAAKASWQGDFRLERSLTDVDARIIVAERVSRKPSGRPAEGSGKV